MYTSRHSKCRLCGLRHHRSWKCDAYKDAMYSMRITSAHINGKYCKERNQCSKCGEIKHRARILRHFGGACSPKKCPVCQWARMPYEKHNVGWHEKKLYETIKWLYKNIMGVTK